MVVWEWENKQRRWRPYPPEVTQQLERAYSKNLRSVFLGDSDPSLINYCIHLPQMEQECISTGDRIKVRRSFFPQSSPAGQGAVWQWAGDVPGDWHTYDMYVQCIIEESWGTGAQTLDMSQTFPACPYVINFCNLNQMNSKTGFVRAIRRVQQAAYPVGKPPVPPAQSSHTNIQGSSSQTPYSTNKGPGVAPTPTSSCSVERQRHRGSKDDPVCSPENKSRALISKVLCRSNKSSTSTCPGTSELSSTGRHGNHMVTKGGSSPPKPLPRSSVPPVPRPRTLPPPGQPHFQNSPSHSHSSPQHNINQQLIEDNDSTTYLPHSSRNDLSSGRFGSNHTLDSDCSSLVSGRRPSVDTISTYLSQDDDQNHGAHCSGIMEAGYAGSPVVDKLISVESDENMDEDVFAEDQEVCDVMRGVTGPSPSPPAVSPLSPGQPHHHHTTADNSRSQTSLQPCHFTPINAAQNGSDFGIQLNGVKRKRTGERTLPGPPQLPSPEGYSRGGDVSPWDRQQLSGNRHHFTNRNQKYQHGSRAPIAAEDKLLLQYTSVVESPPDDMCSICMWSLTEVSGYLEEETSARISQQSGVQSDGVVSLNLCKHQFHLACVREMAKSFPQFLECPNCKTLHGEKLGNQPPGNMNVTTLRSSLPGHPDCGTIQITYNISSGIQGPEHPHPGRPYHTIGFPRTAYIPNNEKGKKVLRLLREAWRRRLIFTVGSSVTTGLDNCVTWNEIHHKTEWNNSRGHGYPDPGYLDNTLKELALHGVTESTLV